MRIRDFGDRGYVVLPEALSRRELGVVNRAIEDELRLRPELWIERSPQRKDNFYALLANPAFDRTIANPRVLPLVRSLMADEPCFDEFLLTVRGACRGRPSRPMFHRDARRIDGGPLRHLAVLYYLTDHDDTTHCWTILPETMARTRLPETMARTRRGPRTLEAGARPVGAPAGSAIIFDATCSHAFVRRTTDSESRSIRIHFGRASNAPIGNDTIVPRRLLASPSNPTRQLFRRTNLVTRLTRQRR
ncbi:MAG: phytanoyl-CoA dioxygenase family protein [Vicinamibacterales bacterium]